MNRTGMRILVIAVLLAGVTGCFNPFSPRVAPDRTIATPPPIPNSARNLLLLFEWAYERQDLTVYEELFTADYRFAFAAEEAAGNPPLTRDDELVVARNLFIAGSATEPPANKISLDFASDLVARPDRRPGKTDPWHKEISVRVVLRVETDDITHQAEGKALFFVVRCDSAQIPEELQLRGLGPDPNRWYIERWEDQTGGTSSLIATWATARGAGASSGREARTPSGTSSGEPAVRISSWGALKRRFF